MKSARVESRREVEQPQAHDSVDYDDADKHLILEPMSCATTCT